MVDHGHSLILVLTKSQSEQRRSGNVPRVKFIAVGKKLSGLQRSLATYEDVQLASENQRT